MSNSRPAEPEKVFELEMPTWFEDTAQRYMVSPDAHWAIYRSTNHPVLIDLRSRQRRPDILDAGLEAVTGVVLGLKGELVRRGRSGTQEGWFIGDPPRPSGLPPTATAPRWSPDGALVSYIAPPSGSLFVGTATEGTAIGGLTNVAAAVWAPDSTHLYVVTVSDEGLVSLHRASAANRSFETVSKGLDGIADAVALSGDGHTAYLALASLGLDDPKKRHDPDADRNLDIYQIDLVHGGLRPLITASRDDFAPVAVDDFLYWTKNIFDDAVALVSFTGGEVKPVIHGGQLPSWSPDGTGLGFVVGGWRLADLALNLDAAVVGVDAKGRLTSERQPIIVGYHEDFPPIWSPDGKWIAYHSHRSSIPVGTYDGEGSADDIFIRRPRAPMAEESRLTDFGWEAGSPDWSPDSRRLVFTSWDKGSSPRISKPWIVTIDPQTGRAMRAERLRLPEPIKNAQTAAWSPMGNEIAIEEKLSDQLHALWIVSLDGSGAEKRIEYPMSTYGGMESRSRIHTRWFAPSST